MPDERQQYGGQAVVEGVMMRSPRYFAVACRRLSTGEIVVRQEPVETVLRRVMWLNRPFLRGTLALIDAMALGMKALTYAANVQAQDAFPNPGGAGAAGAVDLAMGEGAPPLAPPTPNAGGAGTESQTINDIAIGLTSVLALLFGFGLFWTLPAFLTDPFLPGYGRLSASLVEGGIRLAIFFLYIGLISQMAHVRRVFQYHGAEHKAINTLEAGLPVTLENARRASRIHPRCGTNFIFIVLVTAILVFSILPRHSLHEGIGPVLETAGLRLLLLPVVAGIAFEILKWAGANRDKSWAQALIAPGLWTQYLTTRVPDDSQIEVAIVALESVWDKEHEAAPAPLAPAADEPAAVVA
ncbi:MAG: DUF1385 domain-containing protein [Armatimonadetes bacterium]|nr:DUF1385 domain-containing protein [Armatimonadota bacterium]